MKRVAIFLLLMAPFAYAEDTGIECAGSVCRIDIHVLQALLQQATRGTLPCYQRT